MKRLYVLVNKHLKPIYGCVQAGHAVAQWLLEHPNQNWNNEYLIYLYANIDEWLFKLDLLEEQYTVFREPDLDNIVTTIAIESNGNLFKNLELVK